VKEDRKVRVRFAPSPTGYLHIGGARTALFNWLFARHEGGAFIVRIEDTDVDRSSGELERQMLEDLVWLGLEWDEGPGRGGGYGPYRQSERVGIYRDCAERLVSDGRAYRCFCTDEELERRRAELLEEGLPLLYDGRCRSLSEEEREACRREGKPESVRFVFPEGVETHLDDIIRRSVVFPPGMVGDFVIIRSNGLPTYNFAAAVDDALMKITHVIRGEEHLSNTLRQLVIYDALGLGRPRFAHIPLIHGSDHTKLSKRHGAPNIRDYRERGYPPEAVVNYLAFLGWSPGEDGEILTIEELAGKFALEHVSRSPSIFDEVKMSWFSAHHIRMGRSAKYFEEALPFFPEDFKRQYAERDLRDIFDIVSDNLTSFSKIGEAAAAFRRGRPEYGEEAGSLLGRSREVLAVLIVEFESCGSWSREAILGAIKAAGKSIGVKGADLYMPLRAALTGDLHGPDLAAVLSIRGKDDVIHVLRSLGEDTL
jgi:nondiscriminating glutamyl-tRNA synthetase